MTVKPKARVGQVVTVVYHKHLVLSLRVHLGHMGTIRAVDHKTTGPKSSQVKLHYLIECECKSMVWMRAECIDKVQE